MKIITVCAAGLCRSVAMADVLKCHFRDTDVVPVGVDLNSDEIKTILFTWADKIILMEKEFIDRISHEFADKILICDVGPDIWKNPKHPELIGKVWDFARTLGLQEHSKIL